MSNNGSGRENNVAGTEMEAWHNKMFCRFNFGIM